MGECVAGSRRAARTERDAGCILRGMDALLAIDAEKQERTVRAGPGTVALTQVTEWDAGKRRSFQDCLAAEEPLEIRVNEMPLTVTMRTPGHDTELAAGLLWTEGIVESADQIVSLRQPDANHGSGGNRVDVDLRDGALASHDFRRTFFSASGCGICGKQSIEAIRRRGLLPPNPGFRIDPELLCQLPERLGEEQQIFRKTGGLHAAALFSAKGELLVLREDIGRHNAVDKVVGWALMNGRLPLTEHVLAVSGRGGFEIVQKAIAAGVPVLASVSAPSSLAVKLARELGLTLVGFVRGRRFVVYSGDARCFATSN